MIHEIGQFIEYLENNSSEIFSENLKLKEGLYVFLEKENGELVIKDENILKREKPKFALIGACVYYACKGKGIMKTTKELAHRFGVSGKQMTTGCKQFNEIMFNNNLDFLVTIKPITYYDCINSLCDSLGISDKHRYMATNVAEVADKIGVVSDNIPPSIAVSAVFMIINMLKLPVTKQVLSKMSNISGVTISKTYNKMYPYRKYLLTQKCR